MAFFFITAVLRFRRSNKQHLVCVSCACARLWVGGCLPPLAGSVLFSKPSSAQVIQHHNGQAFALRRFDTARTTAKIVAMGTEIWLSMPEHPAITRPREVIDKGGSRPQSSPSCRRGYLVSSCFTIQSDRE